ncbi:unnamed protein product [marine sediment metagenome]|uniref:HD domain-containing protein n=1 Tax=marine sediment metagenome TaxID=412755 RepID=X1SUP9_9ZZZZ
MNIMNVDEMLSAVRTFAYNNSEKDDLHGFKHVGRVLNLCVQIGTALNANLLIIKIAALLHDVGRIHEKKNDAKNHAEISAEMAKEFFHKTNFNITIDDIENIIHSIRAHSFSNNVKPKTLEAKILSDADKLDALGAIGLYRTIIYSFKLKNGGIEKVINHLENKILKLKDGLYLEVSKQIAEERSKIIIDFYDKIREEIT